MRKQLKKRISKLFLSLVSLSVLLTATPETLHQNSHLITTVSATTNTADFLREAKALPYLSTINGMTTTRFEKTKTAILAARNTYHALSNSAKNNIDVKRWEGFLTEKETAIGISFVENVKALPSIATLNAMTPVERQNAKNEMETVRSSYQDLSQIAKKDEDVSRWESYLVLKEVAVVNLGETFIENVQALPYLSAIAQMDTQTFTDTKSEIIKNRNLYNELSNTDKNNTNVVRWEGYLSEKETAMGIKFVEVARELPSISSITTLETEELSRVKEDIETLRVSYQALFNVAKKDADVERWEDYLTQKEDALIARENQLENLDITFSTHSETEKIEYNIVYRKNNTLPQGKEQVIQLGIAGEKRITYENRYENGELVSTKVVEEEVLTEPVEEIIEQGTYIPFEKNKKGFISILQALPSVYQINNMTAEKLLETIDDIKEARSIYESLSNEDKQDSAVARWEGYLSQKESAATLNEPNTKERIAQIQQKWSELRPVNKQVTYVERPSTTSPYILGKLSDQTLIEALNVTNFIRYVGHLPADVQLNEEYNTEAQAASLVSALNGVLSHYPSKPASMDQTMFDLGAEGASTSNLGIGYSTIVDSIVSGYMNDGDYMNIDRVGHRLWILSPVLKEVGFGFVNSATAMKVIADDMYFNDYEPYDYVSWPAETAMPIEFFQEENYSWFTSRYPWSVSLNTDTYNNRLTNDIKVTLTRLNDNKTWVFDGQSNDGYFNVSTDNYGQLPYTVIFQPGDTTYKPGDKFNVTITGLTRVDGVEETVSFDTTFFDL